VVEKELARAGAFVCFGDRDVRDVAVVPMGEEVFRLLQVHETHRLAVFVLRDEDVAVGRLLVEVLHQVGFDALQAVGARAPVGKREVDEAVEQTQDEFVVVALGETDQKCGIAHRKGHRLGRRSGQNLFSTPSWRPGKAPPAS